MNRRRITWPLIGALALAACGSDSPDRAAVVGAMTDTAVPARYDQLADQADTLVVDVASWCDTADATAVEEQVTVVRGEWVALSPFWFGPVMDRRSRFVVDTSARADDVDELLAGDEPIDATGLRERFGADQRGLQALSLLIEGATGGDVTERRCDYATAIAELVAEETGLLADDWVAFGPAQSADEASANEALELLVNESLFALDSIEAETTLGGEEQLAGVRLAIIGDGTDDAPGLTELLDDDIVEQLTVEFDAADSLDTQALNDVDRTIITNIVSALGLSVQFSDADGDG